MRELVAGLILSVGMTGWAQAWVPAGRPAPSAVVQPAWAPACGSLLAGAVVRSARPFKEGAGTERRRFWRGHWRVTSVLDGGRFLATPLFLRDDGTGEIRRGGFEAFPGETARMPPGALMCEAFVTE